VWAVLLGESLVLRFSSDQVELTRILTGGAIPPNLRGTTDDTLYTHYSSLSTVQANWGLKSLGKGDTIA
jgi:hypothetical protein